MTSLLVINPLGRALEHYVTELDSVLRDGTPGSDVQVFAFLEPSAGNTGRGTWLRTYFGALWKARKSSAHRVVVVWPVLGYLDVVLARLIVGRRAAIVIHDTEPLVRSIGYGGLSRFLASLFTLDTSIIIHSSAARRDLRWRRLRKMALQLPHPILEPTRQERPRLQSTVVRALGQFKPDRDLEVLRAIGRSALSEGRLEVVGRGWPAIDGWLVSDRFVTEDELNRLIDTSDAVLIPYRRFYQSGIAIRCLERGIPVVGPADSSLSDLFDPSSGLLVSASESAAGAVEPWLTAVRNALLRGPAEAESAARRWRANALEQWGDFMRMAVPDTTRGSR